MIDNTGNGADYAVREIGSTDSDTANDIGNQANALYMVGVDSNDDFEVYLGTADIRIYMVGQTKQSAVYFINDVAVTDPTLNSWQQIDATLFSVTSTANGVVLRVENNQNKRNELGLRHGDSTDEWDKSIGANDHTGGIVGLNDLSEWGEYMNSANVDVSIAAYTIYQATASNINADMDVVIRTATGDVRATLGLNVATTTNVAANGWVTLTGTFTPAEYTIVDQTDYLEIDLYARITGIEADPNILTFMLDDKTVAPSNWTHIENIGLLRD